MRLTTLLIIWIVRLSGITQIVVGLLIWSGRAITYTPMHIGIGFLVVAGMWALSVQAFVARRRRALAAFALLWGVALPAFGIPQASILTSPSHWLVRVVHLVMGLVALGVADTLAKSILRRPQR